MFSAIKNLFKKKEEKPVVEYNYDTLDCISAEDKEVLDYDSLGEPRITGNLEATESIILLDDKIEQFRLYDIDINRIKKQHNTDIMADYKLYNFEGKYCGFIAKNHIHNLDNPVLALLDITLETTIRLSTGEVVTYDGIDIGIMIHDLYPKCKILFCTAHTFNRRNPTMSKYIDKYEQHTKTSIDGHYLSKSAGRAKTIHEFLYGKRILSDL